MKLISQTLQNHSILLEKGDREVGLDDCVSAEYYFSNNDGGVKQIGLLLKDKRDIVIDFGGAELLFRGRILPFVIDGCQNITLKNFSVNYDRPFYSQGDILAVSKHCLTVRMDEEFPYRVADNSLIFVSDTWENDTRDCWVLMQEFDAKTRSLAPNSVLRIGRFCPAAKKDENSPLPMVLFKATDLGDRVVALETEEDVSSFRPGYKLVMTHEQRSNPAIAIQNSSDIHLENIQIIHAGAMGVIAQLCRNIEIDGLRIDLVPGKSKGLVSTNCDATHFVNCAGMIHINHSVLNNMMDDGVNIHGVYTRVERVEGNVAWLKIMHFQQYGINFYQKGDVVVIHERSTVKERGRFTVRESRQVEPHLLKVTFEEPVTAAEGDFADSYNMHPDVLIENTETGYNRPRGFLLTTNGKVVIRNNTLNSCCYGVHIAGDMTYWYESTGVKSILIENNTFRNNCVQYGDYSIAITPEFERTGGEEYFHKNIKIRGNTFYTFVPGVVYANGVDDLEIRSNSLIKSRDYTSDSRADTVETINCRNVIVENNLF